ncbi:MAG: NB-ARC domain-containing protein [Clostridia bacterium]
MSYKNYATRMSCFALISAVESDIRNIIFHEVNHEEDLHKILPQDVLQNASNRLRLDNSDDSIKGNQLLDLLEYVDFYDLSKILHKIKNQQVFFTSEQLIFITTFLEKLTPARNRVCHSRPLEIEDFSALLDFSYELLRIQKDTAWKNLNYAVKNLNDTNFVLTNSIPDFWKKDKDKILQNLPLTEFDDTGFLGRKEDRKKITDLIISNTRVISIIGEGGIGKTALAQRCLYDILELCESQPEDSRIFDMILWVSLKTNRLTQSGAVNIKNAITNSSDMFKDIYKNLAMDYDGSLDDVLKEILEYLETFKILLCIDNLETISSSEVRNFLSQIPNNSKVIITTRMGLGEIEYRFKLDKLNDKDSIELLRHMAKLLNISSLLKKNTESLKSICKKLYNNPLLIKWYVFNEASGNNMRDFLDKNSQSFKDALKFCFENLYDNLDDLEIDTISAIACIKKPVTNVELKYYLDDLDEIQLQQALNQLFNSSMLVAAVEGDNEKLYSLTGIAEEYITSLRPVNKDFYQKIKTKQKQLQLLIENERKQKNHYKYDLSNIHSTNKDETICALYLKQAIAAFRSEGYEQAKIFIDKAKALMPEYSEIYRINSFIMRDANPFVAETELETAIEYSPKDSLTRYAYAKFLVEEEDFLRAEEQINEALKLDPNENALITFKAWVLTLNGNYIDALVIYERLLNEPDLISSHRKFRASTFDQAISCYKRYAEVLQHDNDENSVEYQIKAAFEVANKAIYTNNYDNGIFKQFFNLTRNISYIKNINLKNQLYLEFWKVIECNFPVFNYFDKSCLIKNLDEAKDYMDKLTLDRISNLLKSAEYIQSGSLVNGYIQSLRSREKGADSVSYGFIIGDDSKKYFFNRNNLIEKNIIDNYVHCNLGEEFLIEVTFNMESSEKGDVALNIDVKKIIDLR